VVFSLLGKADGPALITEWIKGLGKSTVLLFTKAFDPLGDEGWTVCLAEEGKKLPQLILRKA